MQTRTGYRRRADSSVLDRPDDSSSSTRAELSLPAQPVGNPICVALIVALTTAMTISTGQTGTHVYG